MISFRDPVFLCCPLPAMCPRCHNSVSLGTANTSAKLQNTSAHQCFLQGKWWCAPACRSAGKANFDQDMYKRSRATCPSEAHLVGVGGDPSAFSGDLTSAAATLFSIATFCFFGFCLAHSSLQVIYTFSKLFYLKRKSLSDTPKQSRDVSDG
jgi:hypothetical protein